MDIFIDAPLDKETLSRLIDPILKPSTHEIVSGWDKSELTCDYTIVLADGGGDFCRGIDLPMPLASNSQFVRELSQRISTDLHCQVLCDGSGLGHDDSPYWSLLFQSGTPFLVDDSYIEDFRNIKKDNLQIVQQLPSVTNKPAKL